LEGKYVRALSFALFHKGNIEIERKKLKLKLKLKKKQLKEERNISSKYLLLYALFSNCF
jgi:hypothetical protein